MIFTKIVNQSISSVRDMHLKYGDISLLGKDNQKLLKFRRKGFER